MDRSFDMKCVRFVKVVAAALCAVAVGGAFADGPWEIEGGWSNEVLNAENKTEYVVAFTNTSQSYTLTIQDNVYAIQYLVVGGGGGGGGSHGGGGGAGGMLTNDSYPVSPGDVLTITVGAGGGGGVGKNGNTVSNVRGVNGGNSSISKTGADDIVAYGGGGGGGLLYSASSNTADNMSGKDGGSGGGCAGTKRYATAACSGGSGTEGQGYAGGGRGTGSGNSTGKGGGGAGAAATANSGKNGGIGLASSITGEEVYYAGGGGGGGYGGSNDSYNTYGLGGTGGGARGGSTGVGYAGVASTGGGGGGGGLSVAGGGGGSGIVIIRYAVTDTSGGIVVTSDGGVYGTPEPNYGSYVTMPETSEYTCDEYVQVDDGVRAYCTGWKLYDGNGTLVRSSDSPASGETVLKAILGSEAAGGTLRWQWEVRYLLTLELDGVEPGEAVADWYAVDRSGYYAEGATVSIEAVPAANYSFSKWMFGGEYSETTTNPLSLEIGDEPIVVAASFVAVGITSWYGGQTVGGVEKVHYFANSTIGQTYSITCPKCIVVSENAQRKRCIGYTLKTLPDGAESALVEAVDGGNDVMTAQIEFSAPVLVSWKWIDEFHVTTTVQEGGALKEDVSGWYTNSAKVVVEVASTKLFRGWGGFPGDRSGSVVTATVANAAMTVTAYFAETPKENLVLNGDFEMNSDSSHNVNVIANFNQLNAGSWRVDMASGNDTFPSGILAAQTADSFASNVRTYGNRGLSGMVTTGKNTNVGVVSCEVNLPYSGTYEFSCVTRKGSNSNQIGSNTWSVRVELVKGEDAIHIGDFPVGVNAYVSGSAQVQVRRGGTYRLKFSVPVENITGTKNVACTAFDEVSFKLVSGMPFVIFVR